ncbi:MAG TPA: glycosyltransferase family 2 protein [Thermoanaerobaculaceae bacterium]|nr:glycosyltransferase family 2 protein [Thermoanaerobaculaceae bacterium]HPS77051.1 glycosyltransferase family 2 protein [Thermoanaerobaculaceae bacterium]
MRAAAVVINHNGGEDVPRCLAALGSQTVGVEVVLVDCASTDGTRGLAERPPGGVIGMPLGENRGYAGGANAGLGALAAGVEAVGLFNPDCFPEPRFYEAALARLEGDGVIGGVAGRLVRPGGAVLDSCGQVLTPWVLRVRDRGYGCPADGAFGEPAVVLAACGAGMVYRRAALEGVAVAGRVFPDEFFAFWEDLDLGWRVSAAGWRVVYEPSAVAAHRRGGTAAPGAGRLVFRRPPAVAAGILVNRWATWLRNLAAVDFWLRLPVLLPADAMLVLLVALRRPTVLPALARAMPRLLLAWRQRPVVRRRRLRELP